MTLQHDPPGLQLTSLVSLQTADTRSRHLTGRAQRSWLHRRNSIPAPQVTRLVANPCVKESLSDKVMRGEGEKRKLRQLADLLDGMLALDPERRISVHSALKHPFIKDPFAH